MTELPSSLTHTLVDHPEYTTSIIEYLDENERQSLLLHVQIHKNFTDETERRFTAEWVALRQSVTPPIFTIEPNSMDQKWEAMASSLGFDEVALLPCTDGQSRRLFVSVQAE